jgi:hypothetical protein
MCGIIGIIARDTVASGLLEGLRRLEYRGYDSADIATLVAQCVVQRPVSDWLARAAATPAVVRRRELVRQSHERAARGSSHWTLPWRGAGFEPMVPRQTVIRPSEMPMTRNPSEWARKFQRRPAIS